MTRPPGTSVRWLSMSRCASSASSARTEILMSALPSTATGKIEWESPDDNSEDDAMAFEEAADDARLDVGRRI